MSKTIKLLLALGAICFSQFPFGAAHAQATRTWVSGVGDDVNPCSRTAPCKTFAGAISKTAAGGEISVLDPGGYGAVTVTKGITLNGEGTLASILSSGTNGININAPAGAKIIVRNLSINGAGTTLGLNGIRLISASQLIVERTQIYGYSQAGIDVNTTAAGAVLNVKDVVISQVATGINVTSSVANGVKGSVVDTNVHSATSVAVLLGTNANVAISNSTLANNAQGLIVNGAGSTADLSNSVVANNTVGLGINAASKIRMVNNDIYDNTTQLFAGAGATFATSGNNRVDPASATATVAIPVK
jgi:hypothetical protein